MKTCFVIQPFDELGLRRFNNLFAPAIRDAGLIPERADQPGRRGAIIDEIHSSILRADVCLADISNNNPNVWYELGVALSGHKRVVLVCSDERNGKYPFDIQHLCIFHFPRSPQDWGQVRADLAVELRKIFVFARDYEFANVQKEMSFGVTNGWDDNPVNPHYEISDARIDYDPREGRAHLSGKLKIRRPSPNVPGIDLEGKLIGSGPVYDGYALIHYRVFVQGEETIVGLCMFRPREGGRLLWVTSDLESGSKALAIGSVELVGTT